METLVVRSRERKPVRPRGLGLCLVLFSARNVYKTEPLRGGFWSLDSFSKGAKLPGFLQEVEFYCD